MMLMALIVNWVQDWLIQQLNDIVLFTFIRWMFYLFLSHRYRCRRKFIKYLSRILRNTITSVADI